MGVELLADFHIVDAQRVQLNIHGRLGIAGIAQVQLETLGTLHSVVQGPIVKSPSAQWNRAGIDQVERGLEIAAHLPSGAMQQPADGLEEPRISCPVGIAQG